MKPLRYRVHVTTIDTDIMSGAAVYENEFIESLGAGSVLVAVKEALDNGAVTVGIYAENLERI